MSVFGTWLQSELDKRGWDQRQAAQAIKVRESSVHNWIHQGGLPSVRNVAKIARYLDVPIEVVWDMAGYEKPDGKALAPDKLKEERARVLASLPQFADILDIVADQPPEPQAIQLAMIRRLLIDPESNPG
jgi:transcriptional regulator with XRE-family HTH domain